MKLWWIRCSFSLKVSSDVCEIEIVPALHGTACPRFPGSASCSPRPAADGSSTKAAGIWKGQWGKYWNCNSHEESRLADCTFVLTSLTLLSSFWYCGIFFSIWDRSLMVVWKKHRTFSERKAKQRSDAASRHVSDPVGQIRDTDTVQYKSCYGLWDYTLLHVL